MVFDDTCANLKISKYLFHSSLNLIKVKANRDEMSIVDLCNNYFKSKQYSIILKYFFNFIFDQIEKFFQTNKMLHVNKELDNFLFNNY